MNGNNNPNTWISAITTAPIISIYDADGGFNYEPNELTTVSYNGKVPNAISDLKNVKTLTENTRLLSIVYVEYQLLNDLTLKADIGLDLSNIRQSNYAPSYTSLGADKKGVASIGTSRCTRGRRNILSTITMYLTKCTLCQLWRIYGTTY